MKKRLWRVILFGFILMILIGSAGFGYHNYRVMQRSDPIFFSGSTKHIPARKLVPKTFVPRKVVTQQPKLSLKAKKLKQLLEPLIGGDQFVGTILIVKNGQPIYDQGYGYANFQKQGFNTAQSEYQILSMQKSMTATLLMQQVEAGRLRLTDRLAQFYPNIPGAKKMTIRSMLNMTTGLRIHNFSTRSLSGSGVVDYAAHHVQFLPNQNHKWSYQPVNYTLLAGVLQRVTHRTYYQLFNQHIIRLLDLHHSGFVMLAKRANWLSTPYHNQPFSDDSANYLHAFHESPANQHNELATGNVYMNASDFYKVSRAILQARFVSVENTQILHDAAGNRKGYAGGLYHEKNGGYWSHGVGYGEESGMMISGDGQNAVIMLSNYRRKNSMLKQQCHQIYQNLMQGMY
ncbi:serine hydrolase domain-containing protein [Pediococcus parvulus]|uniref:serine hydrolase domain-containing protein n=1 Tax=Pediococcus parvulus TaxID=54062 RepID=UPI0021A306ED|nr:serine hydrolase domain-containing protein [Pediococcus parvulus]MCT3030772.1 class A beta-lactamase-related serine hydrolase [Pediococcus parvulus]